MGITFKDKALCSIATSIVLPQVSLLGMSVSVPSKLGN